MSTPPAIAHPPPPQPPAIPPPAHRGLVRTLIVLATVLSIVAIFAVWANRQLLNTDAWTSTSSQLIESPPVREAVSAYLTEQIYANVNVTGEVRSALPTQFKPLAGPAASALRTVVQKGVTLALERPFVQELWRTANETAHTQFVKLVENRGTVVKTPGGGAVVLDLRSLVAEVAKRVGISESTVEKLPANIGEIQIMKSSQLQTVQTAVNLLRYLALALPLLALAIYALAVYLAHGRRPQTLISVGFALIVAGLIVLIVRSVAGGMVVGALAKTEAVRPAANAVYSIGTSVLAEVSLGTIFIGVPVVLAGLLAGPYKTAAGIRRSLAPYLRYRPGVSFGALGLILLLLLIWSPIAATRNWLGILVIIALSMLGLEMLRRQTAAEFPDVQPGESLQLRRHAAAALAAVGRAGAEARAEVRAARARHRGERETDADVTLDGGTSGARDSAATASRQAGATPAAAGNGDLAGQLERLAALRGAGALSDQEYSTAKQRLLAAPS